MTPGSDQTVKESGYSLLVACHDHGGTNTRRGSDDKKALGKGATGYGGSVTKIAGCDGRFETISSLCGKQSE